MTNTEADRQCGDPAASTATLGRRRSAPPARRDNAWQRTVEFEWYSAHDRHGRTLDQAQTLEDLRRREPNAHSYRERYDRGHDDIWTAGRNLELFAAGDGELFG